MKNIFGKKFDLLLSKNEGYQYFTRGYVDLTSKAGRFEVLKFNMNSEIINNAIELACHKKDFTMNYDQNGMVRTNSIKIANQTKGILAEIGTQLILEQILGIRNVYRWDLERENFEYTNEEYDVKFIYNGREYICESRSSTSFKTSLREFIERYHVIGSYTSSMKQSEKLNDFYFRPVFQYKNYNPEWIQLPYNKKITTIDDLYSGELELFFVSGATLEEMVGEDSIITRNGQQNARYREIEIMKVGDINKFLSNIDRIINTDY